MELTKGRHNVYALQYHMIFVVKYRQTAFLNKDLVKALKLKFEEISESFDVDIVSQEVDIDHIHLLISTKPTLDLTKYINIMKGHSSRFLRKEFSDDLKGILWGDAFWSPSYYLATTGNVGLSKLVEYVESQGK